MKQQTLNKINQLKPYMMLVLFAVGSRLLPHPPNVTAIGALSLYSGKILKGGSRYLAPLAALLISDTILGYYDIKLMLFVYIASLAAVPCARLSTMAACGGAAMVFFIISNFGVWAVTDFYPQTASGLINCYIAAIPYLGYSLIGNLLYYPAMLYASKLIMPMRTA